MQKMSTLESFYQNQNVEKVESGANVRIVTLFPKSAEFGDYGKILFD